MLNLNDDCEFIVLSEEQLIVDFDCGNADLNDFFNRDAIYFKNQMLAMTGFFRHNETDKVICAFSLSPNGLKAIDLPNSRRKKVMHLIPREKILKSYPAFLVGRFGVALDFAGQGVGSQLMEIIKLYCFELFSDFCRFLVVDAYNEPIVLNFYQKNKFTSVFSSEEQEQESFKPKTTKPEPTEPEPIEPLRTRYMFYDMIELKNKLSGVI
jgi:GNAT superfamily N-acetyltransferase